MSHALREGWIYGGYVGNLGVLIWFIIMNEQMYVHHMHVKGCRGKKKVLVPWHWGYRQP